MQSRVGRGLSGGEERRVVSDISLMEGGNLGVGRNKKAAVGFIMSEHTQLYLPSHLSGARGGERGTFFAVFAQLKANATRARGDANPV